MGRGRRRIIQDEIHIEGGLHGPARGANRGAEVEGTGKGGGPWRVVMTVLRQRAQRQRPEGGDVAYGRCEECRSSG